ncbi:hypothetical protein [uncultured Aquitalea sp.]|uniref:hypothetical protein n=1 Tax=uncultured Aquitalea sp. TaxID=540272 RepID=UPI0025FEF61A|nr:hypothetical protein [uncultured Aquitalea sp.]
MKHENQPINDALKKALETTLRTAAEFKGEDTVEYLTGVTTAAISLLRAVDDGRLVYGYLRSALASLGQESTVNANPHGGDLGVSVHMGASMANPEMLHSVEELRRELHSANEQLIERDIKLADSKHALQPIIAAVGQIAGAHLRKDAPKVNKLLNEFCKKYVRLAGQRSDAIH